MLRAFALSILLFLSALPESAVANERAFKAFIKEIKQEAEKDGIARKHLEALDRLTPRP